jgi:tRNA(Ile)-lysidine synthase
VLSVAGRVAGTIERHGLLDPGAPVLALVSGGADSVLLAAILHELGHPLSALHVAHEMRGAESAADARFCAVLCERLGVPLDVAHGAVAPGANLESRLRDARRRAAAAAAAGRPVATGHTASDVAETALYRLATSGSVRSLPALRAAARAVVDGRPLRLVRPLVELTRGEVRDELRRRGQPWREDPSNDDRRHARARVRLDVLPALRALNPAAERNVARAALLAADERALLDGLAAALVERDGGIDLDRLAGADPALARLALRDAGARAGVSLSHLDVEALRTLGRRGRERRSLAGGATAEREGAGLRINAVAPTAAAVPAPLDLRVPGEISFGAVTVAAAIGPDGLDPALAGRLRIRAWRPGDRLEGDHRAVAERLARASVPAPRRPLQPVVECDGEIVCVPGVAIAAARRRSPGIVVSTLPPCSGRASTRLV